MKLHLTQQEIADAIFAAVKQRLTPGQTSVSVSFTTWPLEAHVEVKGAPNGSSK